MAFENTMDKYGDEVTMARIIERTIDEYCDDSATAIGQYAFHGCTELTKVDIPNVTSIEANALYNCSSLEALILGGDAVVTLANTNALTGSGIAKGTGYVYVPSALMARYQAATNWSTYSAQFLTREDYPEITGG